MGEFARKADGRRVFSAEFKRATVQRVLLRLEAWKLLRTRRRGIA